MRNVVSVSLNDRLLKKLSLLAKAENTTRSEIIKRALTKMFFANEFSKLRNKALTELARKGTVFTEDEIFKDVS